MKNLGIISKELKTNSNVKLTLYNSHNNKNIKSYNLHNTGTIKICEYLRDALAGDYIIAKRPGVVIPCRYRNKKFENIMGGIGYDGRVKKLRSTSTSSGITLVFILTSDITEEIKGLKLCSLSDDSIEYALLDLTNDGESIKIGNGQNLKIEWSLIVEYV